MTLLLALVGIANALRVLWIVPMAPNDDEVWDACLLTNYRSVS